MIRYVAFLRAINVGGHVVKMTELKALFESLGFSKVETFIASGNVIFSTKSAAVPTLVKKIESALEKSLGYEVKAFLRTDAELAAMAGRQHALFTESVVSQAHSLSIGILHEPLTPAAIEALRTFNTAGEEFRTCESEIHMLALIPTAESKFSITKLEKKLGVRTTFRNVNTLNRIAAKYKAE